MYKHKGLNNIIIIFVMGPKIKKRRKVEGRKEREIKLSIIKAPSTN